jgi:type II secretory pathway pseudopilin PulG
MAVLFLLLAFLCVIVLAAAGLENTNATTATLFDRSFGQLTEGQLLIVAAALGFLVALFLFLAFGASRTRRARRKELKSRRRDAESRVDELERENARLQHELANTHQKLDAVDRNRTDAVAERDRAEAAVDRVRAANRDRADAAPRPDPDRTGATAIDDRPPAEGRATAPPPEPASVRRERLDDRTGTLPAADDHARAADEHAQAAEEHARAAADEETRRR